MSRRLYLFCTLCLVILWACSCGNVSQIPEFPARHFEIEQPVDYAQMVEILQAAATKPFIELKTVGSSVQGRELFAIHLTHQEEDDPWKVFLFAQQHGDEPAGKDALLYLIQYIAADPALLPDDVDLWIMPMVNPDGAEANQRRNGNQADLNRDHILLAQPETRALHKLYRRIMPHVAVDCHEFGRDSQGYLDRGWREWPLIMMDCANNPLFDRDLYYGGVRWCEGIRGYMQQRGHNYTRYHVGGVPPREEQRYSTPEVDDARNGLGAYGGLSFIIESGIKHKSEDPQADLGERVDACLDIFKQFLYRRDWRAKDRAVIRQARQAKLPDFIPTNYFWGNKEPHITRVKVIDMVTDQTIEVATPNFMHDMIVKKSVPAPQGYLIEAPAATIFQDLLDRHGIQYELLSSERNFKTVESCRLERIEEEFDPLYARYGGRQIANRKAVRSQDFAKGTLFVPLNQKNYARKAVLILEPIKLYGLYQYEQFHNHVHADSTLPVYRVLKK